MKAKIKFYSNLFEACSGKDCKSVVIYADSKDELYNTIHAIETDFLVVGCYIDDGSKKEEAKS